ncbi:hypothetical protein QWY74_08425 [Halomonas almeriensis]|uniref:hypothetical protein n=1 Tax=Halomonas almeriensis TaxID=308163 RepID=UPI0025B3AA17|nr:hypothetical protein [Halomonas almeriensis]MDN3553487.1 hypothetical protein [Halomonas almeriensis]
MRMTPLCTGLMAAALTVLPCSLAQADAERLEADLEALFAERSGELTIGDVSDSMLGGETQANNIAYVSEQGERLRIDRYAVEGDYDDPDQVVMEGVRLADEQGDEAGVIELQRLVATGPSRSVLSLEDGLGDLEAEQMVIDGLSVERRGSVVFDDTTQPARTMRHPRLTIESLELASLSPQHIGSLVGRNIRGSAEAIEGLGDGEFSLASLDLQGLHDLQSQEARADRVELEDLDISAEGLSTTLERLLIDSDMTDGAGGLWLESMNLDLAGMIELAPLEERTRLRMMSNVLTGGSGQLMLDAAFDGRWEDEGENRALLISESRVTAGKAFRWTFDSETPARMPEGVEPASYLTRLDRLDEVTLLGGEVETTLSDLGLFGRLPAIIATTQGMSEADFLAQARTQAKGLGGMFGPEAARLLGGLVDMMEGKASELVVSLSLPEGGEHEVEALANDPLVLPSKLDMQVQTR